MFLIFVLFFILSLASYALSYLQGHDLHTEFKNNDLYRYTKHHLDNSEITRKDQETSIEEIIEDGDIEEMDMEATHGNDLYDKELKFLSSYINIIKPGLIRRDDFYYCVHNFRCSKLSNVPYLYVKGICSKYGITDYRILKNFVIETSGYYIDSTIPLVIRYTWRGPTGVQGPLGIRGPIRSQLILE